MFNYENFYTGILSGRNVEFENYISLILSKFQVQPVEDIRRTICRNIATEYTNPSIELFFNIISNPR